MFRYVSTTNQYLSNHHSILGPSRFLPFHRGGGGGPIFNIFNGGFLPPRPMMHNHFGYGGGMMSQSVIINNGRSGFFGGLADLLEGFTRGLGMSSWMFGGMGGGMMPGMMPGMTTGMMPGMTTTQQTQTTDADSNRDYNNLKKLGDARGFKTIVREADGSYTAFNPKTGEHVSGDYETVRDTILGESDTDEVDNVNSNNNNNNDASHVDDDDDGNDENPEVKPQGKHTDNSVVKPKDLKTFKGDIRVTDDGLGTSADISGETKYSEATDKDSGYNSIITVDGYRYQLVTPVNKEKVMYKSLDGDGQSYRLEWKDDKVILVQHRGDAGFNKSDIHT